MGDDFIATDILSVASTGTDPIDFDPNAVESDDFLDDPEEALLAEDVDDLLLEEEDDDDTFDIDE